MDSKWIKMKWIPLRVLIQTKVRLKETAVEKDYGGKEDAVEEDYGEEEDAVEEDYGEEEDAVEEDYGEEENTVDEDYGEEENVVEEEEDAGDGEYVKEEDDAKEGNAGTPQSHDIYSAENVAHKATNNVEKSVQHGDEL